MSRSAVMDAMEKLKKECVKWRVEVELHASFSQENWQENFDWKFNGECK